MPRVGGEFVAPFPDVVPDTTIESAVHNGIVADFVADANAARPITAGGTGAVSATAARANLVTEISMQAVTNFDSHVWEAGSFVAMAGATAAPTPGEYYFGFAYGDTSNMFVEARNLTTGVLYLRRKLVGTWGAWTNETADYVNTTGDTMTGPLILTSDPIVSGGAATKYYVDTTAVLKTGDTMSGALYVPTITDPGAALQAANKTYVDGTMLMAMDAVNTLTARLEALERKLK